MLVDYIVAVKKVLAERRHTFVEQLLNSDVETANGNALRGRVNALDMVDGVLNDVARSFENPAETPPPATGGPRSIHAPRRFEQIGGGRRGLVAGGRG